MISLKRKKFVMSVFFFICTFFIVINPNISAEKNDSIEIKVSPHQNIQDIINSIPAFSTIRFSKGTYSTPLTIDKPLTLIGNTTDTNFIITTKPNNAGIILKSSFIKLSNITVMNTAVGLYTTAIRINSPNCKITNCTIRNTPIGVAVWNNNTKIDDTTFINCSDEGILLISTSISKSNHNRINNCNFYNNCDGIELQQSCYNTFSNCIFENSTHSAIDGICKNNNYNLISNCIINNSSVHGIYFSSSKHNKIKNCSFSNNNEGNIHFTHNSKKNIVIRKNSHSLETSTQNITAPPAFSSPSNPKIVSTNEMDERTNSLINIFKHILELINNKIQQLIEI